MTPIRHFRGHTAAVTATALTPDNAVLLTASDDRTLRMYHMSTNQLIDIYQFAEAVTAMSFQPAANFLATVHRNTNCVYLWTNNLKYGMVPRTVKDEACSSACPLPALVPCRAVPEG